MFRKGMRDDAASALAARGGKARAETLTPERRKEIARAAARKRWAAYAESRRTAFTALTGVDPHT